MVNIVKVFSGEISLKLEDNYRSVVSSMYTDKSVYEFRCNIRIKMPPENALNCRELYVIKIIEVKFLVQNQTDKINLTLILDNTYNQMVVFLILCNLSTNLLFNMLYRTCHYFIYYFYVVFDVFNQRNGNNSRLLYYLTLNTVQR